MNILHASPRYLPAIGGAEKHLHEFSRRFAGDGDTVRVVTGDALDAEYFWNPAKARVTGERETIDGVLVQRYPLKHFPASPLTYRALRRGLSILSDLGAPLSLLDSVAALAPRAPSLQPALRADGNAYDLVAGMNIAYESFLIPAQALAQRRGVPWVLYPLTHLGDPRVRKFYTMRQQLTLAHRANAVITQTRGESEFFQAQGIDRRRLIRLGPGVNPDELQGGDAARARSKFQLDGPVILYLGTVSNDKGAGTLLAALEDLPEATLVYAGAVLDEWQREFQHAATALQARTRVPGVVSDLDRNDLLAACDVLALPSRVDSFGIVLLEAWLYGKPVVGAAAGGLSDVIDDERDGLLVPFGDAPALAHAIRRVLQDPAWAKALGARGCAKVHAEHTWEYKYRIVREVYTRLIARQPLDDLAEQTA